ncbi:unnamed protein product, partial [Gulo gulo]
CELTCWHIVSRIRVHFKCSEKQGGKECSSSREVMTLFPTERNIQVCAMSAAPGRMFARGIPSVLWGLQWGLRWWNRMLTAIYIAKQRDLQTSHSVCGKQIFRKKNTEFCIPDSEGMLRE